MRSRSRVASRSALSRAARCSASPCRVGAFAAAGALGIPTLLDVGRLVRKRRRRRSERASVHAGASAGRPCPIAAATTHPRCSRPRSPAIAIVAVVYQIFSLKDPQPGLVPPQREVLGHAIVANGCWSPALGGAWRPDDDLRYIFDSTFEQIAFGTFPWGVLGPIAFAALIASDDPKQASPRLDHARVGERGVDRHRAVPAQGRVRAVRRVPRDRDRDRRVDRWHDGRS